MQEVRETYNEETQSREETYGKAQEFNQEIFNKLLADPDVKHVEVFEMRAGEMERRTALEGKAKLTHSQELKKIQKRLERLEDDRKYGPDQGIIILTKNGHRIEPCNNALDLLEKYANRDQ